VKWVVILMLMGGVANAQSVDEHVKAAEAFFKVGNFEGALAEFRAAYEIDPRADFLFAMAAIEEQRGGCRAAIELYEEFLATKPPEEDVAAAESSIAVCKEKLGIREEVVEEEEKKIEPEPVPEPEPEPEPEPVRRKKAFYTDVLGDVLVGGGAVGLGVGGGFFFAAMSDRAEAEEPGTTARYERLWDRAQERRMIALYATGAGAALVIGGIVRWMTVDRWEVVPAVSEREVALSLASRW
jgi:tetratricopeptide (TPR) repeat protein